MVEPDVRAEVRFLSTEEGGRRGPTPAGYFGCPLLVDGEYFDCRLMLDEVGPIAPGQSVTVPIALLRPELAISKLAPGARFQLWEGRIIADGRVLG